MCERNGERVVEEIEREGEGERVVEEIERKRERQRERDW